MNRRLFATIMQAAIAAPLGFVASPIAAVAQTAPASATPAASVNVAGMPIAIEGDLQGFRLTTSVRHVAAGIDILSIVLDRSSAAPPPRLTLRWSLPSVDIAGMWTPAAGLGRKIVPDFDSLALRSDLTSNAPVMTLFGRNENNRITIALSDAMNPTSLAARLREEDVRVYLTAGLLIERHDAVSRYAVDVRIDTRSAPFSAVLGDVASWWAEKPENRPNAIPAAAREPLDSTWYSYHQYVNDDAVKAEALAAAKRGLKVIIVDDGWQTDDSNRGYGYAGDWEPQRLRRMRAFTDMLHQRGMKGMLWFSVPLVGEHSRAFVRFKGKILRLWPEQSAAILDPRYPEVRSYLIETFRRAVGEWGWDGLKLDFIDMFKSDANTPLTAEDGRDYASVYEAVDRLMTDIAQELRKTKSDVLIEFRQPYTGPRIRKYGNMLRASDAPNSSVLNRQRIVDLRLLSGATPVHADPIVWHPDEPVEAAARQLLDTLFSVPQVSMKMDSLSNDHARMLGTYLDYWTRNRDVLLDGRFEPRGIEADYELVRATGADKQIVALYADHVVDIDAGPKVIDIFNVTATPRVFVHAPVDLGSYRVTTSDALGKVAQARTLRLTQGAHMVDVPVSGRVSFEKIVAAPAQ